MGSLHSFTYTQTLPLCADFVRVAAVGADVRLPVGHAHFGLHHRGGLPRALFSDKTHFWRACEEVQRAIPSHLRKSDVPLK